MLNILQRSKLSGLRIGTAHRAKKPEGRPGKYTFRSLLTEVNDRIDNSSSNKVNKPVCFQRAAVACNTVVRGCRLHDAHKATAQCQCHSSFGRTLSPLSDIFV